MAEVRDSKWFKKAEARLYAYPALLEQYKILKEEQKNRSYVGAQTYDPMNLFGTQMPGSGAAGKAHKNMNDDEKLRDHIKTVRLEKEFIKALFRMCCEEEKILLEKYYFTVYASRQRIMMDYGFGQNVFYRLRRGVVQKAALVYGYLTPIEYAEERVG